MIDPDSFFRRPARAGRHIYQAVIKNNGNYSVNASRCGLIA